MKKLSVAFLVMAFVSVAFGVDINPKIISLSDNEANVELNAAKKIYAIYYASNHAKI